MSKWFNNFLQKCIENPNKNTNSNLSGLSGPPGEFLDENLESLPLILTDKTDKSLSAKFLSGLSGPPRGGLGGNLESIPSILTDKTDQALDEKLVSVLSGRSPPLQKKSENSDLVHEFEERIAIAEYDGQQNTLQAQRIAYQDAFIIALTATPYEATGQSNYQRHWFPQRIKGSQAWLVSQGIYQPE